MTQNEITRFYFEAIARYSTDKGKIRFNPKAATHKYWATDPMRFGHPLTPEVPASVGRMMACSNWVVLVWTGSKVEEWPVIGVDEGSWE